MGPSSLDTCASLGWVMTVAKPESQGVLVSWRKQLQMCLERLVGHVHGGFLFLSHCHPHPGKLGGPDSIYGALKRQLSLAFPSLRDPAPLFPGWPQRVTEGWLKQQTRAPMALGGRRPQTQCYPPHSPRLQGRVLPASPSSWCPWL